MKYKLFLMATTALAAAGVAVAIVPSGGMPVETSGRVLANAPREVFGNVEAQPTDSDIVSRLKIGASGSSIYGYQSYADVDGFVGCFCEITPDGTITPMWDYSYSTLGASMSSGWLRGDRLCGLGIFTAGSEDLVGDYAYQEFDPVGGQQFVGRSISVDGEYLPYFYKAAYVPEHDLIYGFGRVGDPYQSEVYAFKVALADSPETAEVVAEIEPGDRCYSLCWHPVDKCFYGVTTWGKFVKIMTDGTTTELFEVPVDNLANSPSAMVYSPYDGYLLWNPAVTATTSVLYAVYPDEKRVEKLHTFDVDRQFSFFLTPDFEADDAAPGRPLFAGAGFAGGSHDGSLSFTMPSATIGGDAIGTDMAWTLYANGDRLAAGTAAASATVNVAVESLPDAYYTFRFEASLDGKAGAPCVTHLYVGNDTPLAPVAVTLTDSRIAWEAVTEGEHGGHVDAQAIEYEVYLNGELLATTGGCVLDYALDPDRELDAFRASVTAVFDGRKSAPGVSEKVIMGRPLSLPVTIEPTLHQVDLVTTVNRDGSPDYGTWRYSEQWDLPCFASGWSYERADDWLILPVTYFPSAEIAYNFAIDAARGGNIGTREYFEVWAGTEPDPEAMTIPVMSKTRAKKYNEWNEHTAVFAVPAPGNYYVAVHGVSDPDQKDLIVRNIRIWASQNTAQAPESVSDLQVVESSDADYTATLSFTMPSKYIDGTEIPADIEVKATVMAAGNIVVAGAPGSAQTVTVPTVQGDNYISVVPSVAGNEGQSAEVVVFTGVDMLSFVENLKAEVSEDNMSVVMSWEAPVESLNGGYFSTTGITYWVAQIDSYGTILGEPVCAGTDVFEYTLVLPEGTPQALVRLAVIPENAAGMSYARSFYSHIIGTPYDLPVLEEFDDMTAHYQPIVVQQPDSRYEGGSWTWCQPELVHPDFANSSPYAIIGYTDDGSARVRMRLPKVSTVGMDGSTAIFEFWGGHHSAQEIAVYAITYGMAQPEKIATLEAGDGWTTGSVDLPDSYIGRPWMNLYVDALIPSSEHYFILSSYCIDEKLSVADATAHAGSIVSRGGAVVMRGFDGMAYMVTAVDGRVVARGTAASETSVALAPGVYIVKAGARTAKVAVR